MPQPNRTREAVAAKLLHDGRGQPRSWAVNVRNVLLNDPEFFDTSGKSKIRMNQFKNTVELTDGLCGCSPGEYRGEEEIIRLRCHFSAEYGFEPSRQDVHDAVIDVAKRNSYNPLVEYLNSLVWDNVPRIDTFFSKYCKAVDDPEYLKKAGQKFTIGAVARAMQPGCQNQCVPVLEGSQGIGKSSVPRAISPSPEFCSDTPFTPGDKDAYGAIGGKWIIELAELDALGRAATTTMKSFISSSVDRYRPPYGRTTQDFPRCCVFIGTTNHDEYLKDDTGNRRFWPIRCGGKIDIEGLIHDRDQIWAEAVEWYRYGMTWWVGDSDYELFDREQEARRLIDPWFHTIEKYLRDLPNVPEYKYLTSADILRDALKKPHAQQDRNDLMRIAPIMQAIGWNKEKPTMTDSTGIKKQRHAYRMPDDWGGNDSLI